MGAQTLQTSPLPEETAVLTKAVTRAAGLLGLTQRQVAETLGLSGPTASRLFAGKYRLFAGAFNEAELSSPWAARGPATPASPRMAPLVTPGGEDFSAVFGAPGVGGIAVFRSRDNDNLAPIEAQLDELNYGTSYAAAYATGAGAIVRDYFAQGY